MEQSIFIHSWAQHCTAPVCQSLTFIRVTETRLQSPQTIFCCHLLHTTQDSDTLADKPTREMDQSFLPEIP